MKNYLVISSLSVYDPALVNELTRICFQCKCNILTLKMTRFGQEEGLMMLLTGNWSAIAKLEAMLSNLEERLKLKLIVQRTQVLPKNEQEKVMSYLVNIMGIDNMGILSALLEFLAKQEVQLEDTSAHTYEADTGTKMFSLSSKINIPQKVPLANFREQLMAYCDNHNIDMFMEPFKN